jgi:hypothetical protein
MKNAYINHLEMALIDAAMHYCVKKTQWNYPDGIIFYTLVGLTKK